MTKDNSLSILGPFRHKNFFYLWSATLLGNIGFWAQSIGATWLIMEVSENPALIASVQVIYGLPTLLLSLVAGTLADIYCQRNIQLIAQYFMLLSACMVLITGVFASLQFLIIILSCFIAGTGSALRAPAWQASLQYLVNQQQLQNAITLSSAGFNSARIIGPALGGLIIYYLSPRSTAVLHLITALLLILVLQRLKKQQRKRRHTSVIGEFRAGIRYCLVSARIKAILIRAFCIGLGSGVTFALLPVLVQVQFASHAGVLGALLGSFGFGAVSAAFTLPLLRKYISPDNLLTAAVILSGVCLMSLVKIHSVLGCAMLLVMIGMGWIIMLTTLNIAIQTIASPGMCARALSAYMTLTFGGLVSGSALWGWVSSSFGISMGFISAGITLIASSLLKWTFPVRTK